MNNSVNAYELLKRPVCLIDFETTGLNPQIDRAIEVAAIRIDETGRKDIGVVIRPNPVPELDPKITELTGITQADLEAGVPSFKVFNRLREMVDRAVIIGHNVPFDIGFLQVEFHRHDHKLWAGDFICTRALATFLGKGMPGINARKEPYTSYKLADVCKALGFELEGAHRAMNDLEATEQALLALYPRALAEHRPIYNAMVRPGWVQEKIDAGRQAPEYEPPRGVVYLVA